MSNPIFNFHPPVTPLHKVRFPPSPSPSPSNDHGFQPSWATVPAPVSTPLHPQVLIFDSTNTVTRDQVLGTVRRPIWEEARENDRREEEETRRLAAIQELKLKSELDRSNYYALTSFAAVWGVVSNVATVVGAGLGYAGKVVKVVNDGVGQVYYKRFNPIGRYGRNKSRGVGEEVESDDSETETEGTQSMLSMPPHMVGATPRVVRQSRKMARPTYTAPPPGFEPINVIQPIRRGPKTPGNKKLKVRFQEDSSTPGGGSSTNAPNTPAFVFNTPKNKKMDMSKKDEFQLNINKEKFNSWMKVLHDSKWTRKGMKESLAKLELPTKLINNLYEKRDESEAWEALIASHSHNGFLSRSGLTIPKVDVTKHKPIDWEKESEKEGKVSSESLRQQKDGKCRVCRGFKWAGIVLTREIEEGEEVPCHSMHKSIKPYNSQELTDIRNKNFSSVFRRWCQESRWDWLFEDPSLSGVDKDGNEWSIANDDPRLRHVTRMKELGKVYDGDLLDLFNGMKSTLSKQDLAAARFIDAIEKSGNLVVATQLKQMDKERKRCQVKTELLCVRQVKVVIKGNESAKTKTGKRSAGAADLNEENHKKAKISPADVPKPAARKIADARRPFKKTNGNGAQHPTATIVPPTILEPMMKIPAPFDPIELKKIRLAPPADNTHKAPETIYRERYQEEMRFAPKPSRSGTYSAREEDLPPDSQAELEAELYYEECKKAEAQRLEEEKLRAKEIEEEKARARGDPEEEPVKRTTTATGTSNSHMANPRPTNQTKDTKSNVLRRDRKGFPIQRERRLGISSFLGKKKVVEAAEEEDISVTMGKKTRMGPDGYFGGGWGCHMFVRRNAKAAMDAHYQGKHQKDQEDYAREVAIKCRALAYQENQAAQEKEQQEKEQQELTAEIDDAIARKKARLRDICKRTREANEAEEERLGIKRDEEIRKRVEVEAEVSRLAALAVVNPVVVVAPPLSAPSVPAPVPATLPVVASVAASTPAPTPAASPSPRMSTLIVGRPTPLPVIYSTTSTAAFDAWLVHHPPVPTDFEMAESALLHACATHLPGDTDMEEYIDTSTAPAELTAPAVPRPVMSTEYPLFTQAFIDSFPPPVKSPVFTGFPIIPTVAVVPAAASAPAVKFTAPAVSAPSGPAMSTKYPLFTQASLDSFLPLVPQVVDSDMSDESALLLACSATLPVDSDMEEYAESLVVATVAVVPTTTSLPAVVSTVSAPTGSVVPVPAAAKKTRSPKIKCNNGKPSKSEIKPSKIKEKPPRDKARKASGPTGAPAAVPAPSVSALAVSAPSGPVMSTKYPLFTQAYLDSFLPLVPQDVPVVDSDISDESALRLTCSTTLPKDSDMDEYTVVPIAATVALVPVTSSVSLVVPTVSAPAVPVVPVPAATKKTRPQTKGNNGKPSETKPSKSKGKPLRSKTQKPLEPACAPAAAALAPAMSALAVSVPAGPVMSKEYPLFSQESIDSFPTPVKSPVFTGFPIIPTVVVVPATASAPAVVPTVSAPVVSVVPVPVATKKTRPPKTKGDNGKPSETEKRPPGGKGGRRGGKGQKPAEPTGVPTTTAVVPVTPAPVATKGKGKLINDNGKPFVNNGNLLKQAKKSPENNGNPSKGKGNSPEDNGKPPRGQEESPEVPSWGDVHSGQRTYRDSGLTGAPATVPTPAMSAAIVQVAPTPAAAPAANSPDSDDSEMSELSDVGLEESEYRDLMDIGEDIKMEYLEERVW